MLQKESVFYFMLFLNMLRTMLSVLLTKYCSDDQIEKNLMGGAINDTCLVNIRNSQSVIKCNTCQSIGTPVL
jgi:hypothetical protein